MKQRLQTVGVGVEQDLQPLAGIVGRKHPGGLRTGRRPRA
jgi:hypothetical protein